MYTLLYDGTFEGFLSAVFDVYYYKFDVLHVVQGPAFNNTVFEKVHLVHTDEIHSMRVWTGLSKKLSPEALQQVYRTFLSGLPGIETVLLQYIQYAFAATVSMETDFSQSSVLTVQQTAKKVQREAHRMEAFVRFQQTADALFYAIIEPDYNVLPLITPHFRDRFADQRWMIWDGKRRYGISYDLKDVSLVQVSFNAALNSGKDIRTVYSDDEIKYQQLWQQYFKSVNIPARKNTKLHVQHMPIRYWKFLPEKRPIFR